MGTQTNIAIVQWLWLIPVLPLVASLVAGVLARGNKRLAIGSALAAMGGSLLLSLVALGATFSGPGEFREYVNLPWIVAGELTVSIGWVLDPLTACMLAMVTFVGLLIFIFSIGYMAHDANITTFFSFLSLFAAAMLGLVISNSLLLLFICWELVGVASFLLIGFWYHKPSATAAARKAFLTTRVGDLFLLAGMVWLQSASGSLLFYDFGGGCLETASLRRLSGELLGAGFAVSSLIGLLIFAGAVGKSGQVPLHVWLPDAMEGPTPVSALIHAATMVAAGVFLVARVYPLMSALPGDPLAHSTSVAPALQVVGWVGAITALFAAVVAVAQTDMKRILAYSTVSQLGYMFLGLAVGGVAVGMFHLIAHAFFKALLFLGAGSVIHGCGDEQDIRRMGGLKRWMPVTFATYSVGLMALAGVPLFPGFWSKDAILHAAHGWSVSAAPYWMGMLGAVLTAFYSVRQLSYVFLGEYRGKAGAHAGGHGAGSGHGSGAAGNPHESPRVMLLPLVVLAVSAMVVGFLGTPFKPVFQHYLGQHGGHEAIAWGAMAAAVVAVLLGGGVSWVLYAGVRTRGVVDRDPLAVRFPGIYRLMEGKFFFDELYAASFGAGTRWVGGLARAFESVILGGVVAACSTLVFVLAWFNRMVDDYVINGGFDVACARVRGWARVTAESHRAGIQGRLQAMVIAVALLVLWLTWGGFR